MHIDKNEIDRAVIILREGGIAAFPTDTVFGLGADAYSLKAVEKLFKIKGRSFDNPIPVLIAMLEDLPQAARFVPQSAEILIEKFWPGPLTLVLPKTSSIPSIVTGGRDSIAVRIPDHPLALELLRRFGNPLAVTSANISGKLSAINAEEIRTNFADKIDIVLPGETVYKKPSTVVDCTVLPPVIIRHGVLGDEIKAELK